MVQCNVMIEHKAIGRWMMALGAAIKRAALGKSSHGYMKQFCGGDKYWDAVVPGPSRHEEPATHGDGERDEKHELPETVHLLPVSEPATAAVDQEVRASVPTLVLIANLTAVIVPFLGLVTAIVLVWGWGFRWIEFGLLLGMYLATVLGITVGFHRLFTHHSFETSRVVQFLLAVLGSMAVQGPLLKWVALHRRHHQYSDTAQDPHSPNEKGGLFGLLRGLWHAHLGWLFEPDPPDLLRYVKDLRQSRALRVASALFPVWVLVGLLIPTVLGGLLTRTWTGALFGLVWGGLARIFLVHHVTWSVNSVCHLWGRQSFRSGDRSRNNFVFGVLALGEGWHNNHHAFPTSARHGLRWWQIDASYWVICALCVVGLAWKVRLPAPAGRAAASAGSLT